MAAADLVACFGDELHQHLAGSGPQNPGTSLGAQLLLKAASNDKRFVVEEAARALQLLTTQVLLTCWEFLCT